MGKKESEEPSLFVKFASLTVVIVIAVIILFIINIFHEPSAEPDFSSCETRFDSTACPEPDYDKELYETVNQYPDDSY